MMLYPSIDKLLTKIDSKYSLVAIASKRAHDLQEHSMPMLDDYRSVKPVGKALEEVASGLLEIRKDTIPKDE
ncbi:MAG: DNA-directed RNA polymerase subunit omega [Bavariicoccus seileri]|nr:DNA-directed RNA polymerase subunit omega [Bavariicoccus seileri]